MLGSRIRGMPVPTQDRTWAKFRSEASLLNTLLHSDYNLITGADSLLRSIQELTPETWLSGGAAEPRELLRELETKAQDRERMLQVSF